MVFIPNITTNHASTYTNRQFHYLFKLWKLMCLLTSASKVSRARERKTVTGNCTINVISSSNQHGRNSLPKWGKTARGNRLHIFTGVKPLKTFYALPQWGERFDGFYTLKFERWYTVASVLSGPRYGSVQFMFSRGIMCKLRGTFNVQQTIYSVCAFSCWICCPLIRCMSV